MGGNRVNREIPGTGVHTKGIEIDSITNKTLARVRTKGPVAVRRRRSVIAKAERVGTFVTGRIADIVVVEVIV